MNKQSAILPSPAGRSAGDEGAAEPYEETIARNVAEIVES